ncbi:hypothetical protein D9613_006387 [Agrocybe pediades]|uniref:Nephrocystin 3-like N-terminal domain-containing protein n=1 Tax=Agrocybe pediades TaxID=84607 RepID=A0A8H4VRQ2_9AGAR|nr:hypothetical protein D9613_006387 [Agrocybe pediades]
MHRSGQARVYELNIEEVVHKWWRCWQEAELEAVAISQCRAQLFTMQPPHSTPMITSERGVVVTGGQFIQQNYHGQISVRSKAPIDILTEAVAPNALHNSGATFDKPKCHPRTRVKIREIIMRWIVLGRDQDDQAGKEFLWLNGAAGCGKSAIAQSTVESCIEQGLPLASFFFNRSDSTRNHAGSLVATLAYQLYCAFRGTEVQKAIHSAIQEDPLIFEKTLQDQFTSLIIQPLKIHFSNHQSMQHLPPFLIVIDGLDECTDRNAQKAILTGLAESLRDSNLYIPIFVASRPEHDIKLSFSSKYLKDIQTGLSLDLADEDEANSDIRLYLFDRFAEIKDEFDNRTTARMLAQHWPGDEVIETLVKKSSRQFIYAATVIRYVGSTRHRPDHRLDIVLNLRPDNGDHPFAELDSLYAMILESTQDIEKVLHVLSLYLMGVDVSCSVIEKLVSYNEGNVETLFCDLGALIQVFKDMYRPYDPEDRPLYLRFLHASFREYLLDAARSKQFHIDMDYETIKHVTHALQYLASCCSSSFNSHSMHSTAGIAMYILYDIQRRSGQDRISQITISLEFRQSMLSFLLKEFLERHSTSTRTYRQLLEDFVTPFLQLLQAMVLIDPTSSYIRDHQLRILRTAFLQKIPQYINDDRHPLVLVLFYHMGTHSFVPKLWNTRWSSIPSSLNHYYDEGDILSLSHLWEGWRTPLGVENNIYHCFVHQLLRAHPSRIVEYARGPTMHERAALTCFKELARTAPLLPSFSGEDIDMIAPVAGDAEDDTYPDLYFSRRMGEWHLLEIQFRGDKKLELYFLLLGYLIFLLPRCGRSDALVAACGEHRTSYIYHPDGPTKFPIRRRLLHKEINNYLARVSPTHVNTLAH